MEFNMAKKVLNQGIVNTLKPVWFIVIIPSVILLGIIFAVNTANKNTQAETSSAVSTATYKLDKTAYSFGTISQRDGNVETFYELTNTGTDEIFVKEMFTSCMCTRAQLVFANDQTGFYGMKGHGGATDFRVGKSIQPGETVKIKAVFDPNAHGPQGVGYIKRNITLETNLADSPIIQVSFDADVVK